MNKEKAEWAISIIQNNRNASEIAIYAINKLIAKKPIWKSYEGFDFGAARSSCCPDCKMPIISQFVHDHKPKHCSECGQKLDWSEEH